MPTASLIANPGTVLPGQEFDLTWFVCPDPGGPAALPQTATLLLDRGTIFPQSGEERQPGGPQNAAVSGTVRITTQRLRAAGIDPQTFFRVGTGHIFRLEARSGTITLRASVTVQIGGTPPMPSISFVAPPVDPLGSHYPGDIRVAQWNQAYPVMVRIQNSALTTMNYNVSLEEVENTRESATGAVTNMLMGSLGPIDTQTLTLMPGQQQTVLFTVAAKNWVWLTAGVWIVTGPTLRGFTYDVLFASTDEFGNSFAAMHSAAQIRVHVTVSDQKIGFAGAAEGLAILAGVLALAGAFWPPALVASGAAYAGANAFGASALDPPTPDPNFNEQVKVALPEIANYLDKLGLKAFSEWLRAMLAFAATRQGLYLIEAKILGARAAKDSKAEDQRVHDYVFRLQEMSALYQTMSANVRPAMEELAGQKVMDSSVQEQLAAAQQRALTGELDWATYVEVFEKTGIELSEIQKRVIELKPEQIALQKLLEGITLSVGKSLRATIHDSASEYAKMRPEYFSKPK